MGLNRASDSRLLRAGVVALVLVGAAAVGCDRGTKATESTTAVASASNKAAAYGLKLRLWFADGTSVAPRGICGDNARPPAVDCEAECQRGVMSILQRWYQPLGIEVGLWRPEDADVHVVVVTDGGRWCGHTPNTRGIAPIQADCSPVRAGTAYAFVCSESALACATVIAQEHAHLLGVEHTSDPEDVMYPHASTRTVGFLDRDVPVVNSQCGRSTQNSSKALAAAIRTLK